MNCYDMCRTCSSFFNVSPQFFYVITHLYKEGVGKDMKRWAYEITSSFLLPGAVSMLLPLVAQA